MHPYARTALRVTLAGAGIAVLGAGVAGQAWADEPTPTPESNLAPSAAQIPDSDPVADNYAPQGGDSADFTDEQETASPFPQVPGGGSISPLQTVPAPQDVLDTENLQSFFVPDAADIASLIANPLQPADG